MKIHNTKIVLILLVGISVFSAVFAGCSTWEELPEETSTFYTESTNKPSAGTAEQTQTIETALNTEPPAATEDLSMFAVNPITGIRDMDKDNDGKRPIAIMINNIKKATPQVGITECDMFYEIEAEGGITRIMGLFADVSEVPTIGAIRSAREYFVDVAIGYNAIFSHYGTSTNAKKRISQYSVDNLDGMYLPDTYWRDPVRKETMGLEHSALTSGEKLEEIIAKKKYNMTNDKSYKFFDFYDVNNFTADGTSSANKISVKFSRSVTAEFEYDQTEKLYSKSQFGAPHVDDKGKQIKVTNVIVIYTSISVYDDEGHLKVDLSSGKGYYCSGGKMKEIKWTKGDVSNPIKYYNTDGTELTVNAGKTYVCVARNTDNIKIS